VQKNRTTFDIMDLAIWLLFGVNALWLLMAIGCSNPSKADVPQRHLASEFAAMVPEKITGKCSRWTDEAVLCRMSETTILWCSATATTKPHCEVAIDWTPVPPKPPDAQVPAAQPQARAPQPPPVIPKKK
jgi:hypothetical protein